MSVERGLEWRKEETTVVIGRECVVCDENVQCILCMYQVVKEQI